MQPDSNCIDVGCHKGEMYSMYFRYAPQGKHLAFEPLPDYFEFLVKKFGNRNGNIFKIALSDSHGTSPFNFVKNLPAYSGLKKRNYAVKSPDIEVIDVQTERLDDLLDKNVKVDFIKIDVEGGEFGVLKGAQQTLINWKPNVVFEFGLGASEFYGTKPGDLYDYLIDTCGLRISLMKSWLNHFPVLSREEFIKQYHQKINHYFIAHP